MRLGNLGLLCSILLIGAVSSFSSRGFAATELSIPNYSGPIANISSSSNKNASSKSGSSLLSTSIASSSAGQVPQSFYDCEADVIARCNAYGAPAQIYPWCGPLINGASNCTGYPSAPNALFDGTYRYYYNCLYTNPNYPGTLNYFSGFIGSCSFPAIPNNLNLTVSQDSSAFSATPSQQTANGKLSVKPNVPTTIYVSVSGSGFNSPESRRATVNLKLGQQTLTASIAIADIQNAGILQVPFNYTFSSDEAGEVDLQASIMASDDSDVSDNNFNDKMYVLCDVEDSGTVVPFYPQVGRSWSALPYGIIANSPNPGTIGKYGCSVADFAMLIDSYGIKRTPLGSPSNPSVSGVPNLVGLNAEVIDPGTLNSAFVNYKTPITGQASVALNNSNDPIWEGMAEVARAGYRAQCIKNGSCDPTKADAVISLMSGGVKLSGFNNATNSADHKKIYKQLCKGNSAIIKFSKASGRGQHYMLSKGMSVGADGKISYRLSNPGSSAIGQDNVLQSQLVNKYPSIMGYVLYRPAADPSMMTITSPLSTQFVISDPLGRRTGFDPIMNISYSEIPGASYGIQSINTPNETSFTDETLVAENYFSSSEDVPAGNYNVKVFSPNGGRYYLDYRATDSAGFLNEANLKTGTLLAGQSTVLEYPHSVEPVIYPNAELKISSYQLHEMKNGFTQIGLVLTGTLIPNDGSKLQFSDNFNLKIGGDSGLVLRLSSRQFRSLKGGKYSYTDQGITVTLDESGSFHVVISKISSTLTSAEKAGAIAVGVDSIKGETQIHLRCSKNVCIGSDK